MVKRMLLVALLASVLVAIPAVASGDPGFSTGCSELNRSAYDVTVDSPGIYVELNLQSYLEGEKVTVTFDVNDDDGSGFAELGLSVNGDFTVIPEYNIVPASDGSLSHTFNGTEDGIYWVLLAGGDGHQVTVSCTGAPPPDSDGDGVLDSDDLCPGTDLAGDLNPNVKKNRMWSNVGGMFVYGDGTDTGITITDTGGCSASQVIDQAGLGTGHERFGISNSAMAAYLSSLG